MFKKRTPLAAPDLISAYTAALLVAYDERVAFAHLSPEGIAAERPGVAALIARIADQLRREHAEHTARP